jgi:2-keto-4-pentenoate hydratase
VTAPNKLQAAAQALREARAAAAPIPPISGTYGIATVDDAYAVAAINTARRVASGVRVIGRKIGLTSCGAGPARHRSAGFVRALFRYGAPERRDGSDEAPHSAARRSRDRFHRRSRGRRRSGAVLGEFLNAISYALPALEIVDSAIADWKITITDTGADNGSAALFVVGDQPFAITGRLADATMRLRIDGQKVSEGLGSACLDHPLCAAFWLARTLAARGDPLRGGGDHLVRRARRDGLGEEGRRGRSGFRRARLGRMPFRVRRPLEKGRITNGGRHGKPIANGQL